MNDHNLTEDEKRIRDAILMQARGAQNCAPGSPLYDKVMGTNIYIVRGEPVMSKKFRQKADEAQTHETPGHEFTKLILRQAVYFLLLMLAVGVALAVFL